MDISTRWQCNICGWEGEFRMPERGKEGMICGNCSASSRNRAVMHVLGKILGQGPHAVYKWSTNKDIRVLESSARGSYPVMLADKYDYYAAEYDADKIAKGKKPREYADFQNLHYDNESFDLVIASDVFEHVRKDEDGYKEIYRVLKKGGTFILTVPYDHNQPETIQRVDTSGDKDVHLLEPQYHGGGGHTLTYRSYGRDLLSLLKRIGYAVGRFELDIPNLGITQQSVIVGRKGDYVDVIAKSERSLPQKSLGFLLPYRIFLLYKYTIMGFVHYWKEMLRKWH